MMSVVVDRAGPVITFASPAPAQFITTPGFTVEVDAIDLSRVQEVVVDLGGQRFVAADQGSGRWKADVLTAIEEQDRVVTVTARDALGNSASATRLVKVDRIAPTITITIPSANSLQTLAFTQLALTTSADTGQVIASIDSSMVTLTGGPSSWAAAQLPLPSLDSMTASIHVIARDLAGNTASIDRPVLIDNVAPRVVITAPVVNTLHRSNIAVSANTVGGVDTVTATLEGTPVSLTGGPATWTGTFVVPQHDDASAVVRVTATDSHGNSSRPSFHRVRCSRRMSAASPRPQIRTGCFGSRT